MKYHMLNVIWTTISSGTLFFIILALSYTPNSPVFAKDIQIKIVPGANNNAQLLSTRQEALPPIAHRPPAFDPVESCVELKGKVTWINMDEVAHKVVSGTSNSGPDGNFTTTIITPNHAVTIPSPTHTGIFPYFDSLDPILNGILNVTGKTCPR